jgi:hypothetical protein
MYLFFSEVIWFQWVGGRHFDPGRDLTPINEDRNLELGGSPRRRQCARTGHSPMASRTGKVDPKPTYTLDHVNGRIA